MAKKQAERIHNQRKVYHFAAITLTSNTGKEVFVCRCVFTLLSGSGSAGSSFGMKRSTLLSEPCRLWPLPSNRWGLLRAAHEHRNNKHGQGFISTSRICLCVYVLGLHYYGQNLDCNQYSINCAALTCVELCMQTYPVLTAGMVLVVLLGRAVLLLLLLHPVVFRSASQSTDSHCHPAPYAQTQSKYLQKGT